MNHKGFSVFLLIIVLGIGITLGFCFRYFFPTDEYQRFLPSFQNTSYQPDTITSPDIATTAASLEQYNTLLTLPNFKQSLTLPILTYHYIGNNPNPGKDPMRDALSVNPTEFEKQMEYLSLQGFQTISFDTMYAVLEGKAELPAKPVILTFDDGYIDFYVNAFPILMKYKLSATSFIPTGLIGTSYYMDWKQIQEIAQSGLISFQAHSVSHPNLTLLHRLAAKMEIEQSKTKLESELGHPVNFFAYPFGANNLQIQKLVQEAGFVGGISTIKGTQVGAKNIYVIPRTEINGKMTIEEFAQIFK